MDSHKNAPLTAKGREAMVRAVVEGGLSQAAAARQFNVTPKTVAKWVQRFRAEGVAGLQDRSSRPRDDRTLPATMRTLIQGSSSLRRFLRSLFCSSLRRRRSKEPRLSRQSGSALTEAPKVTDKTSAAKLLKQWREEAKRQHLAPPDETRGVTFAAAAVSYLRAGRSKLFVKPPSARRRW
jgi:transposase-like protein